MEGSAREMIEKGDEEKEGREGKKDVRGNRRW